jgi:putative oxidoreductase
MNPATLQSAGLLVLRLVGVIAPLVALFTTHIGNGFFAPDGGFELVLLLAGASATLALAGPGRYSVDAVSGLSRKLTERISRRSSAGAVA